MNNQHAGLSQVLAEQHITERHEQAAHARLSRGARPPRRRKRWAARGWWQLARWTGVATDQQATRRPPTEGTVGESWRHRQAVSQQQETAAEATLKRVQARERFSIPNATPAEAPAPVPPAPSGQSGRLIAWLGGPVAALALVGGLGVLAARRTRRRARLEHAA